MNQGKGSIKGHFVRNHVTIHFINLDNPNSVALHTEYGANAF